MQYYLPSIAIGGCIEGMAERGWGDSLKPDTPYRLLDPKHEVGPSNNGSGTVPRPETLTCQMKGVHRAGARSVDRETYMSW